MDKVVAAEAKTKPSKPSKPSKVSGPNVIQRIGRYFSDVRQETRRVVWPSRQEVLNSTGVVILTLIFFVLFTLAVDQLVIVILELIAGIGG